jgi:hypothetical protein
MSKSEKVTSQIVVDNLREYGFYTLEDRALADARDGLKPVQRRLLWSMHKLKRHSTNNWGKCATVVGDTMGSYHPHGDAAIYGALVTMSWLRMALVQQGGNFGDKDSLLEAPQADQRYTETRLTEFADRIFDDIAIMPLVKSFTEEHDEPFLLPIRAPLLLVNGCTGVALGLATRIPPHNLKEVVNATLHVLENPECTTDDLLKFVKGPDYGNGVLLSKKADLRKLYETGRGRLQFACNYHFEEGPSGNQRLVITGLNPGFKATKLEEVTGELFEAKLLDSAANDEGSLEAGTKIVVEFSDPKILNDRVLPLLRSSITYQLYALDRNKRPRLYSLKEMLEVFLDFRRKVEWRVLQAEREAVVKRERIDAARLAAIQQLPVVTKLLTQVKTEGALVARLQEVLGIDEEQAKVIAETRVRSLLTANASKLEGSIAACRARTAIIDQLLGNIDGVVGERLKEMLKYEDKRGTKLRGSKDDLDLNAQESTYYVGVTDGGKVESFTELPLKSRAAWPYVDLVPTAGKFAVVSEDNIGQSISISFLDKFDKSVARVIGMASDQHSCMVAVARDGTYVAFPPDQRRTQFNTFKTSPEEIVFAGGVKEGDRLIVVLDHDEDDGLVLTVDDLKVTRPNVQPKKLPKLGRKQRTVHHAFVVPADTVAVDARGKELGESELLAIPAQLPWCVGARNLVVLENGKRVVADETTVRQQLQKQAPVLRIIPLPEEDE